jgi:uncharacterized protein YcsI (UPF0317 family)
VIESPASLRARFSAGLSPETTSGLAPGFVQANLVVVPRAVADLFLTWCRANPKPCPVLGVGGRAIPELGVADVARELPRYRVWRDGEEAGRPTDVADLWREDFVSIALGCSYSVEKPLLAAGVRLRHLERGINPPIHRTGIETVPVGPFRGKLIVSMRPIARADVVRAVAISARYPLAHGAPVHVGDPSAIGITEASLINGSPLRAEPGEVAVFWACGVTPESALRAARLPLAITHAPGCMLLTDLALDSLADRAAA